MNAVRLSHLAIAAFACAAGIVQAGGPLGICNSAPLKYNAAVNLNYDGGGTLGTRTKAQADAIVTAAASRWTNVSTATITLGRGPDLPVDVTTANFATYFSGGASFSDALNPVIYDSDGSIIDALLGAGNKSSVLGFAGSASFTAPTCRYAEGRAVINGFVSVSDNTMTTVIAHELGHLIGMDHAQLDSTQGLTGSNYPLMYPIAFRTLSTLHEDDTSAVSALYPGPTVATTYGTLTGNFRLADGVTAVRGANIWARDTTTNRVFSTVSDYLQQNNGAFSLLLLPGTYSLHAEAIASDFDGGSSVGPYADTFPSEPSFQPPLYVGGAPMAALTLGNASPTQIAITAGCTANATFRFNGTGSITGNCGAAAPPPPATPSNARLVGISTRMRVLTGDNVLIGGFVISGSTPKRVVINARGPSLAAQGVPGVLSDPVLTLVPASGPPIVNDNWITASYAAELQSLGLAPPSVLESSILATLSPGAYTAVVNGSGGATGVGIVEVFEVDQPEVPMTSISTRGQVLSGDDVMIGGFIIQGDSPQTVIVRARGPSLAAQGVPGGLANPVLQLFSGAALLASNDDWGSDPNAAQISAYGFAPTNANESALLVMLPPGAYTAIVSGTGGGTGVGIIEVFSIP